MGMADGSCSSYVKLGDAELGLLETLEDVKDLKRAQSIESQLSNDSANRLGIRREISPKKIRRSNSWSGRTDRSYRWRTYTRKTSEALTRIKDSLALAAQEAFGVRTAEATAVVAADDDERQDQPWCCFACFHPLRLNSDKDVLFYANADHFIPTTSQSSFDSTRHNSFDSTVSTQSYDQCFGKRTSF